MGLASQGDRLLKCAVGSLDVKDVALVTASPGLGFRSLFGRPGVDAATGDPNSPAAAAGGADLKRSPTDHP